MHPISYGTTDLVHQTRLSEINKNDLAEFATLLEKKASATLKKLSNAIAPTLSALAAFYQGHNMDLTFSLVHIEEYSQGVAYPVAWRDEYQWSCNGGHAWQHSTLSTVASSTLSLQLDLQIIASSAKM